MALRILPFRQYSDHDVVNLFSVIASDVNDATTDSGAGDAGVFVKVSDGNFDADPVEYQTNAYLGDTSYPFLGTTKMYPQVNLKITGAKGEDHCLGMTLYQTAKNDENGEKLLYNPQKREELQAMLPGQAVPIATKGIFTLSSSTFDGPLTSYIPGNRIKLSALNAGKITGFTTISEGAMTTGDLFAEDKVFGHVLGTGNRPNEGNTTDQFSGDYIVVSFDCN
tara:strand:+ start:279 stop:947 length:669 start_codon:yes stop_codon:yes gene_type:complete